MARHILTLIVKGGGLFLLELPVTVLGLLAVAVGIPFRREIPGTAKPFTDPRYAHPDGWALVRLPRWLLWWDNPYDGLLGDKRGWWDNRCRQFGRTCRTPLSMWLWAAVRNPSNHFSRCVVGVDVSRSQIVKLAGHDVVTGDAGRREWQFLLATDYRGRTFPRFFACIAYPFRPDRALMIDLGWKVKLSHNGTAPDAREQDRFKGNVFTISMWKRLD